MSGHVYKHIELTGTATTTMEDAVNHALSRAAKTVQNMRWLEVMETRAHIEDGRVSEWQVSIRVGFTLKN